MLTFRADGCRSLFKASSLVNFFREKQKTRKIRRAQNYIIRHDEIRDITVLHATVSLPRSTVRRSRPFRAEHARARA